MNGTEGAAAAACGGSRCLRFAGIDGVVWLMSLLLSKGGVAIGLSFIIVLGVVVVTVIESSLVAMHVYTGQHC